MLGSFSKIQKNPLVEKKGVLHIFQSFGLVIISLKHV